MSTAPAAEQSPPAGRNALAPSALYDRASHLRLWPIAVIGLVADLWTKALAFENLDGGTPLTVIPGVLSFQRQVNPGALFGMGSGLAGVFVIASILALLFVLYLFAHSTPRRWSLHVALGLILAGAVGNLYDRTTHTADAIWGPPAEGSFSPFKKSRIYSSGKIVNESDAAWLIGMYPDGSPPVLQIPKASDRFLKPTPVVRDFIKIELKAGSLQLWPWVFNVADSLLVVGVSLLVINFWREQKDTSVMPADSTAPTPASNDHAPSA